MGLIPPNLYEAITNGIGDTFSFRDLDIVVYKCFNDRRIGDLANETLPARQIARDVVDGVERDGLTGMFLAELLADKRCLAPLGALILKVEPKLEATARDLKARVATLNEDLKNTTEALRDQGVRDALKDSYSVLAAFAGAIENMSAYKALHDSLHQLQVRRFADLRYAVETMNDDPAAAARLRDFQNGMRECCVVARKAAGRLPDVPLVRTPETLWINKLEQSAAAKLQKAIDDKDVPVARIALRIAMRLLEQEPSRLNNLIFISASSLQLQSLADAMASAAKVSSPGQQALLSAANSAKLLGAALQSHVVEHSLWQDADDTLWAVDQLLMDAGNDVLHTFSGDWLEAEAAVHDLVAGAGDEDWAVAIRRYDTRMKDALAGALEQAARPGAALADMRKAIDFMYLNYSDFRYEARFRFFIIDHMLMSDCDEIVKMRASLDAVLKALLP